MNPFITAQLTSLAESLQVLESLSTSQIRNDIQLLKESLRTELTKLQPSDEKRMHGNEGPDSGRQQKAALNTLGLIEATLTGLEDGKDHGFVPITSGWIAHARQVLSSVRLAMTAALRAQAALKIRGLYVIVDPEATLGRPVLDIAESTLEGGARVIQYRNKSGNKADMLAAARKLKTMCTDHNALLIINDNAAMASISGSHGLHVGQNDMPVTEARRVLAPGQIIGRSNNNIDEVMDSYRAGADYLAVGAVFATTTMGKASRPVVGVDMVRRVKSIVDVPVVAIGGINLNNIRDVVKAGADSVCVVSAVTQAANPRKAAKELVDAMGSAM